MKIEANKQYHFNFQYEFPNFLGKLVEPIMLIDGYLFEFDNNIYVVSLIKNEKCFKHVFSKEGSLIIFENYQGEFITCSAQTINSITQIYNEVILQNTYNIEELNNNFIEIFNLITPPYQIDRYDLKYSFNYKLEERNKEDYLSKYVEFYSDYAKQFNNEIENNELILNIFKNKNEYWYCISNNFGRTLSKFVFDLDEPNDMLVLKRRENYNSKANILDFNKLARDFDRKTNTSYDMHMDIPDDKISYALSNMYSYFYKTFEDINPLPLFI